MQFHIAETFLRSLQKLTNDEQKAVKLATMELQIDPSTPSFKFHRVDKSKDKNFWSARVNQDIRLIIHKTSETFTVCYADHHDQAYQWAEKRRFEIHATTGAAQIVKLREVVEERLVIEREEYRETTQNITKNEDSIPLKTYSKELLLSYGIPQEWVETVQRATEEQLIEIALSLPEEAAETILNLATGIKPEPRLVLESTTEAQALSHPDARRRFKAIESSEELEDWLSKPWDKWLNYLHEEQRDLVTRNYSAPFRITGAPGTGKSLIAIHRAEYLAQIEDSSRILITSYSKILVQNLKYRLRILAIGMPSILNQIDLLSIDEIAHSLYRSYTGKHPEVVSASLIKDLIMEEINRLGNSYNLSTSFILSEWNEVVDAYNITGLDTYQNHKRQGRKVSLTKEQYTAIWNVFIGVKEALKKSGKLTIAQLCHSTAQLISGNRRLIYNHIIIDECQDLAPYHLYLLLEMSKQGKASLLFLGDDSQRVFQPLFDWQELGFNFKDNQYVLRVNYRTGKAIIEYVETLRAKNTSGSYGLSKLSRQLISKIEGHKPVVDLFKSQEKEVEACVNWMNKIGCKPGETALIVRAPHQIALAIHVADLLNWRYKVIDQGQEPSSSFVTICTMQYSKGLEFEAVAILGCDEDILPLESMYVSQGHYSDIQDLENMEKYMLYVACTRTRNHLRISAQSPGSIFLEDLLT